MSAISSYATATPATGDKLLGTDIGDGSTKNFTVDALKTFNSASPTFTGTVGALPAVSGDVAFDTTTLTIDATGDKVAVGLAAGGGDGTLHVHTATAGTVTAETDADDLVVENSANGGISILTPNNQVGAIKFGDPDDAGVAALKYDHTASAFIIETESSELLRAVSGGDIGIGISSPDGTLHVHTATAGTVTASTDADDLVVENSTSGGISILTPNNVAGSLYFGDADSNFQGAIQYKHDTSEMRLYVSGTHGASIDSALNFKPGTTESYDLGSASLEWDNLFVQNAVTVSDERRKENIVDISNPLEFVNSLRPVKYNLKDTVVPEVPAVLYEEGEIIVKAKAAVLDEEGNVVEPAVEEVIATGTEVKVEATPEKIISHSRPHTGFIAQEVKEAMGENDWAGYCYDEDSDTHMLRLNEFIGYLVGAVKELSAKVEVLENA